MPERGDRLDPFRAAVGFGQASPAAIERRAS
jgi:hypothetical protein